jgi:hypothetical protein
MAAKQKKRRIISLENLEPAVKEALMKKYPSGFEPFIQKIQGLKGETLTIVPLETEDSIFMIKVKPEAQKVAGDDDDDEAEAVEIPESNENFGEEDEFSGKDDDDDGGFKDEPVEEYDDDDADEEEPAAGADDDDED